MSDYHILGPDEKTKRIRESLKIILQNAVEVAEILKCVNREFDAHMVRASVACAMAESEGGDRSMLLPAGWFISRAKELAKESLTDPDVYEGWESIHEGTVDSYKELASKYAALLRSYRKKGQKPYLAKFYQDASHAPAVESCETYVKDQEINKTADPPVGGAGDFFEVFLTVFAQVSFMKIFPTILCASIIGLFCGGLFNVFSSDAGIFVNAFGIVWFIITIHFFVYYGRVY